MKKNIPVLFLSLLIGAISFSPMLVTAQDTPPTAQQVLDQAYRQAAAEKKKVLLIFHASWCGWCHRMDTALADPRVSKYFTDNYVITHLDVQESPQKKNLENEGAAAVLSGFKGDNQGIPFFVILDKDGKLLGDSKIRKPGEGPDAGSNVGCPSAKEEVEYFISLLKKTSSLKDAQLKTIYTRFREIDPHYDHLEAK